MLGVHPGTLRRARQRGIFRERSYKGLGGKRGGNPIPVIYTEEALDPSFGKFRARPHPVWGSQWEFLPDMVPDDLEQPVIRRPVYVPFGRHGGARTREDQVYKDECQFLGWRWVCPGCRKEVRTIYYPVNVRSLFDCWFEDPVKRLKLTDVDLLEGPPATFACRQCHGVQAFGGGCGGNEWNLLISHLTGGLLYGQEVAKPSSYQPLRKNRYIQQLQRQAPRRQMVLRRLLNGWSVRRIAKEMMVTPNCVTNHIRVLYAHENVDNRHDLVAKLGGANSPPLNHIERAAVRRFRVKELLLRGMMTSEIAQELDSDLRTVRGDLQAIYRLHGVGGFGLRARRALAAKLGVPYVSRWDEVRNKVADLREQGLMWKEIAAQLGISIEKVRSCVTVLQRMKRQQRSQIEVAQAAPSIP